MAKAYERINVVIIILTQFNQQMSGEYSFTEIAYSKYHYNFGQQLIQSENK